MTGLYWKCPNCKSEVDFTGEMEYVFDEDGEADFDPKSGLMMHTIQCGECPTEWIVSISKPIKLDTSGVEGYERSN